MGGMPAGMGMPMNMGQMGGGIQGMINPNLLLVHMHHSQNVAQHGKARSTASGIG